MLHNPDNLTPIDYGASEGWRLLDEDEIIQHGNALIEIEIYSVEGWIEESYGCLYEASYRTLLTRAELAEKRGLKPVEPKNYQTVEQMSEEMERLRKTNAEDLGRLTEAVELGMAQAEQYDNEITRLKSELTTITAERAALAKDKARLDWISKGYEWHIDMDYDDGTWAIGTMEGNINDREYVIITEGHKTVRDAIDAAMQSQPTEKKGE